MTNIRFVRKNPDAVRKSQRRRGNDKASVDALLAADEARKSALQIFETVRASQKGLSRSIGKTSPEKRPAVLAEAKALAERVKELEAVTNGAEQEYLQANAAIQDIVLEGVPAGGGEDYEVFKHVGELRVLDFEPKDHPGITEALDAIDMAHGTKVSGSRFYYLKDVGARFELALLTMAVDQAEATGFTMMTTPTLVSPGIMAGTDFLGAHPDEIYYLLADDQYLVDTSEVTLTECHEDKIVDLSDDPLCCAGQSFCHRREAGSYGKDTRGTIHVHQFNKVEMFSYYRLEEAEEGHCHFLAWGGEMLTKVELPHRIIDTAADDLGSSAAQKFDYKAWLPAQDRFMEATSTPNCTAFQAWRLGIRERFDGETRTAATLNETLTVACWLIALFENHRRPDGSLYIPEALWSYLDGHESFEPAA